MTQTETAEARASTKANIRRGFFFAAICAVVYAVATKVIMPSATLPALLEGSVVLALFGLVCWLWPWLACIYLLLVGATLAGSPFWQSPVGLVGSGVMIFPGLVPFLLFIVPGFIRWVNRPPDEDQ